MFPHESALLYFLFQLFSKSKVFLLYSTWFVPILGVQCETAQPKAPIRYISVFSKADWDTTLLVHGSISQTESLLL